MYKTNGTHIIVDLYGCNEETLSNAELMEHILYQACKKAKFEVIKGCFHQFEPQGNSGVILLAESHISYHAYPEHNYVSIDCYVCGKSDPMIAIDYLIEALEPNKYNLTKLLRGNLKNYFKICK